MNTKLLKGATSLCFLMIMLSNNSFSQMKLIKKLLSNEADTSRSSSFLPLPAFGYSQETGLELGIASLYSFYADRKDTLIRTSRLTGIATFTTKKQSNFILKSDIWTSKNSYHITSELRYKNFPFNFYGIGNSTLEINEDPITQKLFRFNAGIEKKLGKISFTGVSTAYESYRFTDKVNDGIFSTDPAIIDKNGGQVLFLGLTQIIDSRNSNTYTTRGTFVKLNYSYAPDFFGGNHFSGGLFKLDMRNFQSITKQTTIGFNVNFQSIGGSHTPFYLLPQLGSDEIMRGYYAGRFRDQNLLALQSEIRLRLNPRFGVVAFAAAGNVYSDGQIKLIQFKPAIGAGFRYFYDIERGLSVRMDYAVGEKNRGETRQSGLYLSLGEAF